jgi:hypothetical protein
MLEHVPIFALLRGGYTVVKNLKRRLWPRTPVEAISVLRDHVELGHDVMLVNTSNEPILIYSFDVVDAAKRGDETKNFDYVFRLEDEILNVRLEPKESKMFNFCEGDFFPMKASNGKYFIRVSLAGQKDPLWLDI